MKKKQIKKKIKLDDFKLESFLSNPDPEVLNSMRGNGYAGSTQPAHICNTTMPAYLCIIEWTLEPTPGGATSDMTTSCKTPRNQCPPPPPPVNPNPTMLNPPCPPPPPPSNCPTAPYVSCA